MQLMGETTHFIVRLLDFHAVEGSECRLSGHLSTRGRRFGHHMFRRPSYRESDSRDTLPRECAARDWLVIGGALLMSSPRANSVRASSSRCIPVQSFRPPRTSRRAQQETPRQVHKGQRAIAPLVPRTSVQDALSVRSLPYPCVVRHRRWCVC